MARRSGPPALRIPSLTDCVVRGSLSSMAGVSDMGSISQFDYKSQEDLDDVKSQYAGTQSGLTVF